MTAPIVVGAVGLLLALSLVGASRHSRRTRSLSPSEEVLRIALDLYRVRRALNVVTLKAEIRQNARETERRAFRELDNEP